MEADPWRAALSIERWVHRGCKSRLIGGVRRLRLSERYIQDLLHSTGSGFAERVLELRLQHAVVLLARPEAARRKISDVALSSGFSDLSYFHRCFRRRRSIRLAITLCVCSRLPTDCGPEGVRRCRRAQSCSIRRPHARRWTS